MQSELFGIVVLFGTALAAAWVMRALRAPTILGFLVAGILLGPAGLGVFTEAGDRGEIHFFAELGLALLLFTVGLELSPQPLIRMGARLLLCTVLQMGGTAVVCGAVLHAWLGLPTVAALVAGLAVGASSTAIVMKHLSDKREVDSPAGAITTGILLLQDIIVIFVLVLIPLLAQVARTHWSVAVGKTLLALAALVAVTLLARFAMPWLVRIFFERAGRELMTLFAIVIACSAAWAAGLAGWSWGLGSFIAGLLLAQTDIRHQLQAEITPFRDAFNALFFMSMGMLIEPRHLFAHQGLLALVIVATIIGKALIAALAVLACRWPLRLAITTGLGASTISEFGYVLTRQAAEGRQPLISPDFVPLFVAWTVGTMLIGAVFIPLAAPVASWLTWRMRAVGKPPPSGTAVRAARHRAGHVIIVGYGVNGRNLALVLKATRIPFIVVEMNRALASQAAADGAEVVVGDAARQAILEEVGLETARALVIAIDDHHATRLIVAQSHARRPDLYILCRTRHVAELDVLHRIGAREVIPEEFETSIEIFAHVLKEFAIPDNVIDQQVKMIRAGQYGMLRGRTSADRKVRAEWLQLLEAALTQTFLVMEGSIACGRTIRELDLRARTGVTLVAVTRNGKPIPNPPIEFVFETNDVLVLVGTHRQLDEARAYLDPPASDSHPTAPPAFEASSGT